VGLNLLDYLHLSLCPPYKLALLSTQNLKHSGYTVSDNEWMTNEDLKEVRKELMDVSF